jgi:formylglycine-generating enzyme required for sulfatase activity
MRTRLILLFSFTALLALLALTATAWLPPLLTFTGAHSDVIQGLEALLQLALWAATAVAAAISFTLDRRARVAATNSAVAAPASPPTETNHAHTAIDKVEADTTIDNVEGSVIFGPVNTGSGDFVSGDQVKQTGAGSQYVARAHTVINTQAVVMTTAEAVARNLGRAASGQDLDKAAQSYLTFILDEHRFLKLQGMGVSDRTALQLPLLDLYVPLTARPELPPGDTPQRSLRLAGREHDAAEQKDLTGLLGDPRPVLELVQKFDGLVLLGDPGAGKTTFLKYLALHLALGQGESLGLGGRLPILAPLSAYANELQTRDVRLDDFVASYYHAVGADLPVAELLAAALSQGKALVLLDGLDEVKNQNLRKTVVDQVTHFYNLHRRQGNKFILSSRIIGYRSMRPVAPGLGECTLEDFNDRDIEDFINRWTRTLEALAQGDTTFARRDAERERAELLAAVQHNEGVRRLAANPLLLTILALMKRQGVSLPERRVELYDRYIETLLSSWNRARGLWRTATPDLDVRRTVPILAEVALWMQQVDAGLGVVKRQDLQRQLEQVFKRTGAADPAAAATAFLVDVREHAGLLLERGLGDFGFIHLTFQEYLAAAGIGELGQGDSQAIYAALAPHVGEAAWREAILLTIGYVGIIQRLPRVAGEVLEKLVTQQPGATGMAVVLAGEALLDVRDGGAPAASQARVMAALAPTMQSAQVALRLRRQAGWVLGRLGWQPDDLDVFVPVPAGEFRYGEPPRPERIAQPFWIAQYPVTNSQFRRFVDDKGYEQRAWWSQAGWAWREERRRTQPGYWDDIDWNNPIFPVVGMSWFEAEAYTRWLNARLAAIPLADGQIAAKPAGYAVRLPTEQEWERAARGVAGWEYPWGPTFEASQANTGESGGIRTTAVCTYAQGVSLTGAWDMSGNVWEWTCSPWSQNDKSPVVRGGSWSSYRRLVRCAYRVRNGPGDFINNIGFRVVVSLAASGF